MVIKVRLALIVESLCILWVIRFQCCCGYRNQAARDLERAADILFPGLKEHIRKALDRPMTPEEIATFDEIMSREEGPLKPRENKEES